MRSRNLRLLAGTALAAALAAVVPAASAAPAERELRPAALPRGANPAVPFVIGTTILDGATRVKVDAAEVQLLGTAGGDYVAIVYPGGERGRVERISPDGERTIVRERFRGELTLSRDGEHLFEALVGERPRTVVRVLDPVTGERTGRQELRGYVRVLDADAGRAVLGVTSPARTLTWDVDAGATQRVVDRQAYFADIRADRLGTYTRDVTQGGCSVLRPLSSPGEVLWRSCEQAVGAVSPDGRRVLARTISLDGPIGYLWVRTGTGRLLASYSAPTGFGHSAWEAPRSVVMTVQGSKKQALVRCAAGDCERASALHSLP